MFNSSGQVLAELSGLGLPKSAKGIQGNAVRPAEDSVLCLERLGSVNV